MANHDRLGNFFNSIEKHYNSANAMPNLFNRLKVLQETTTGENIELLQEIQALCFSIGDGIQRLLDTRRSVNGWNNDQTDKANWLKKGN